MNITITPNNLMGTVEVVSSKSLSHRYLIAAGLAKGMSKIKNLLDSEDIIATKKALLSFNVNFNENLVYGGNLKVINNIIDCNESGSTLRFLIPIAMLFDQEITFIGKNRLSERPLDVYYELFNQKNLYYKKVSNNHLPLIVKGKIKPGLFKVRGDVSSQFLTGLLFTLPLLNNDSVIELLTPLESKGYVDLTLDTLKLFGIHILHVDQYFYIKGNQQYVSQEVSVEGDYSQAAFFMVAGLIGDEIKLEKLNPISRQGDSHIVDLIKQMGGSIEYNHFSRYYLVKRSDTYGITIDLSQIPDLGPILMVLAALSKGETRFINYERLRIKESDRLQVMIEVLTKFGVSLYFDNDYLVIIGQESLNGDLIFDSYNDHRIVMAIAIASIKASGKVTILNADVVKKSYPNFFEVYKNLGGLLDES
jgi:3-phosphoshikimate 1-carboxyvinyltransferase